MADNLSFQNLVDPFQRANQMQADRDIAAGNPFTNANDAFGSIGNQPAIQVAQPTPAQVNNQQQAFNQISPVNKADFTTSQIPQMLDQLGIDSKNIALNPLGRMQIEGRLKQSLGPDYQNHAGAKDILNKFDEYLKAAPNDSASSMNKMKSGFSRTMGALLGGG